MQFWGEDAQDVLGPLGLHADRIIVGENVEDGKGEKGWQFLEMCMQTRLQIHNTMYRDPQGSYTRLYYL